MAPGLLPRHHRARSLLLHWLSPRGLGVAVFVMVEVNITAPAAVLYQAGLEAAATAKSAATLRAAALWLLPFIAALSLLLARSAMQVRRQSLDLLKQKEAAEEQLRARNETAEKASQTKNRSHRAGHAAHQLGARGHHSP